MKAILPLLLALLVLPLQAQTATAAKGSTIWKKKSM